MYLKHAISTALILTATAASADVIPDWKNVSTAAVKVRLHDPDSARFKFGQPFSKQAGETVVCGEVNAKNRLGGYTGFTRFAVRIQDGKVQAFLDGENSMDTPFINIFCDLFQKL